MEYFHFDETYVLETWFDGKNAFASLKEGGTGVATRLLARDFWCDFGERMGHRLPYLAVLLIRPGAISRRCGKSVD